MPVVPGDQGIKSWSYEILIGGDGVDSWEICEDCIRKQGEDPDDEKYTPVFADSEWDRNPRCDECGYVTFIFSPTGECIDDWTESLREYIVQSDLEREKRNRDYLDRVAENANWLGDETINVVASIYRDVRKREG
jgi:hypothetical protein